MTRGVNDQTRRELVQRYFGAEARIRLLRTAPVFGAPIFVVDFDQGPRHIRTLGSFGSDGQVTEQSSMDLLYPAHLVFHYERLMSLALALADRSVDALLLGLGGAAMWRFVRAYVPECAVTLVDSDETVIAVARRWFYLSHPVVRDTAQEFLATGDRHYDALLIDLYDAGGPADSGPAFWTRCLDALAPGGCLAVNWADFATNPRVRPMADSLAAIARGRALDCVFATRRGFRDNLIQYVPTGARRGPEALRGALDDFARARRIPDRGRFILEACLITTEFPTAMW